MYRIRFHGRGGQGMKTASRILGTAFFLEGFEVQDAPRYGAERRGAPIFAFVRASRETIKERGIIHRPDLIIVAEESLVPIAAAGVLGGVSEHAVLLISSEEKPEIWKDRLNLRCQVLTMPAVSGGRNLLKSRFISAACAGAAARLVPGISRDSLEQAIYNELGALKKKVVAKNLKQAMAAYDLMADHEGIVIEREDIPADTYRRPNWIKLPFEDSRISAPAIYGEATSTEVMTGLWRTMRPIIDYSRCRRCWWVCSTFCPDGAISIDDQGYPQIDYDHCKGCMVCLAQCSSHAIKAVPEQNALAEEAEEGVQS